MYNKRTNSTHVIHDTMATVSDELRITVRFAPILAEKMENAVENGGYSHLSEYIREAVREKVERSQKVAA